MAKGKIETKIFENFHFSKFELNFFVFLKKWPYHERKMEKTELN
jgi:hypothetical protein